MTIRDEGGEIPTCPLCHRAITLRNDHIEPHKTVSYTGPICGASGKTPKEVNESLCQNSPTDLYPHLRIANPPWSGKFPDPPPEVLAAENAYYEEMNKRMVTRPYKGKTTKRPE